MRPKYPCLRCFLIKISKKLVLYQDFFSWISQGIDLFWHIFCRKKISHVFFLKYPTTETSDFQKVENEILVSFWTPFFAVFGTFLPDIIGVFWPKKTQDICNDILFFVWYPFFFCEKVFPRRLSPKKKKDITFKVKDIT